jgi:hypothetical protein
MVGRAGQRLAFLGERVRAERAEATALAYPDSTFDLAVAVHVGHHVGNWPAATREFSPGAATGWCAAAGRLCRACPDGVRVPRLAPPGT